MKQPTEHQLEFIAYINNTGRKPLPVAMFDEDWEPVGERVRADLLRDGLIYMGGDDLPFPQPDGIYLRPDLARD